MIQKRIFLRIIGFLHITFKKVKFFFTNLNFILTALQTPACPAIPFGNLEGRMHIHATLSQASTIHFHGQEYLLYWLPSIASTISKPNSSSDGTSLMDTSSTAEFLAASSNGMALALPHTIWCRPRIVCQNKKWTHELSA